MNCFTSHFAVQNPYDSGKVVDINEMLDTVLRLLGTKNPQETYRTLKKQEIITWKAIKEVIENKDIDSINLEIKDEDVNMEVLFDFAMQSQKIRKYPLLHCSARQRENIQLAVCFLRPSTNKRLFAFNDLLLYQNLISAGMFHPLEGIQE